MTYQKKSSIKNSELGVFPGHSFKKNEMVTVYLGVLDKEPSVDMTFSRKLNGAPLISRTSIMEDY
jgi:hypothetical protein